MLLTDPSVADARLQLEAAYAEALYKTLVSQGGDSVDALADQLGWPVERVEAAACRLRADQRVEFEARDGYVDVCPVLEDAVPTSAPAPPTSSAAWEGSDGQATTR